MKVYRIEDGSEVFHIAAETAKDATDYFKKSFGFTDDEVADIEVSAEADDKPLAIEMVDEPGQPIITKTCEEWVRDAQNNKVKFPVELASTVY